jgi:hypothetical protein
MAGEEPATREPGPEEGESGPTGGGHLPGEPAQWVPEETEPGTRRGSCRAGRLSPGRRVALTRHLRDARLGRGQVGATDEGHALYTVAKPAGGRRIDAAVAVLACEVPSRTPPAPPKGERVGACLA